MVTSKTPGAGRDILQSSANNLYDGVAMADLDGFTERHPLNSRLVKRDGHLVEEVYRVGGLYHDQIVRIVGHLRHAAAVAPPALRAALDALVRFYETGDDGDREAFDIAWVQNHDTTVDTMNGFIEVYMDARGTKGAWEGLVYYANPEKTGKIRTLAAHAQWFEDHLPVEPRFRKPVVQGVSAMAIEVVIEIGDSGPITPIGVNLPNDQRIREQYGSKSVSLVQRARGLRQGAARKLPPRVLLGRRGSGAGTRVGGVCRRVDDGDSRGAGARLGPHGRGRDPAAAGTAEGAVLGAGGIARRPRRAVLRGRPVSRGDRPAPPADQETIVRAEYEAYARNALVQLRRVREGTSIEEDHMRNRQAIVHWLMGNTDRDRGPAPRRQDVLRGRPIPRCSARAWRGCWRKCSA